MLYPSARTLSDRPMSNPSYPLVPLPAPRPQQPPTFGLTSQPPEEPSALWRLTVRHYKVLAGCGVASLLLAWACGWLLAKPLWQAEAVLLYRQVQFTAEQLVAYPSPPSLGALAGWLKEPRFLTGVLQESGLKLSPAEVTEKYLKVDQAMMTEVMTVSLKWSDRDTAREMLD